MSRFETRWIDQYVPRKPRVILDVGTRNLYDALRLKKHCPNARVIAFEASRDHYRECTKRNKENSIELHHLAVSDICGDLQFRDSIGKFCASGSILEPTPFIYERFPGMEFSQPYSVTATRLDRFCRNQGIDHIDVIHMDIQGAEFLALKGLGTMRPSLIFLEINALRYYKDAQPVQELLKEMGYRFILRSGGDELYKLETTSQLQQDNWVLQMTDNKRGGYFVDIGAGDGIRLSNTYLLEKHFQWSGICIEANPRLFAELCINRSVHNCEHAVYSTSGMEIAFRVAGHLGGIEETFAEPVREAKRMSAPRINKKTISLQDLLEQYNAPHHIDYLSIDTEGSEFEIIKDFDFDAWDIRLLTIEHNQSLRSDPNYLERITTKVTSHGYKSKRVRFEAWYWKDSIH